MSDLLFICEDTHVRFFKKKRNNGHVYLSGFFWYFKVY